MRQWVRPQFSTGLFTTSCHLHMLQLLECNSPNGNKLRLFRSSHTELIRVIPNTVSGGNVQLHLWDTAGQ